ncbi:hypothetical protein B9Z55_020081 [Caenorhabditis nigoni]|nr:hypothetical protein B9Z55_020081 [Caenorhabditis nigoni]
MCQDVCKDVSCYGDAFCHQGEVTKIDGTKMVVPQCEDKTIDDYHRDILVARNISLLVQQPDYINSNDKDMLCSGITCYGLNKCTIVPVPCLDNPQCVNSDACEDVTCFGDARCKVVNVICYANGSRCDLPRCGDKDTKDYEADVKSAIDVEALVKTPTYINSQDQGVLCQGMNCWGINTCIIVDVKKLNIVSKFLPLCDDSPTPAMLKLSILR